MSAEKYEGGTEPTRLEWIPESVPGTVPSNPAWNAFSANYKTRWDVEPDANTTAQRGSGTAKPRGFFNGSETWEASFTYDLAQWFVDGSGNTLDPLNDAIQLAADNSLSTTHAVVERKEHYDGSGNLESRQITVGKGGAPAGATVPFETEEGTPIEATMDYQFEKIRKYTITQPDSSTDLVVVSTSSNDTTQDVTIENEGAGTSETVTLNGTSIVQTTATFADIDAIELSAETEGNVEVYTNSGTDSSPAKGTLLATIHGQSEYPAGEGDLGVPTLGTGSHATEPSSYVIFLDDTLKYSGGEIAPLIASGELEVDLDLQADSQAGTARQAHSLNSWTATFTVTMKGPNKSEELWGRYLREVASDIVWTADEGTLTGKNARLTSPGTYDPSPEEGAMAFDAEYEVEDITIS